MNQGSIAEKAQDNWVRNKGRYYSGNKQHESAYLHQFLFPSRPMKAIQIEGVISKDV